MANTMHAEIVREWRTAGSVLIVAVGGLAAAWVYSPPSIGHGPITNVVLATCLILGLVLSYLRPVQLRPGAKIYPGSAALYLMAALLPVPLAGVAAFLGIASGEFLARAERGTRLTDIAIQAGRWTVVMLVGASVAHIPAGGGLIWLLPLATAAIVLWVGDVVTSPIVLGPIIQEPPMTTMRLVARDGGPDELGLYVVGLIGAIVARNELWSLAIVTLPILFVYVSIARIDRLQPQSRAEETAGKMPPAGRTGGHALPGPIADARNAEPSVSLTPQRSSARMSPLNLEP